MSLLQTARLAFGLSDSFRFLTSLFITFPRHNSPAALFKLFFCFVSYVLGSSYCLCLSLVFFSYSLLVLDSSLLSFLPLSNYCLVCFSGYPYFRPLSVHSWPVFSTRFPFFLFLSFSTCSPLAPCLCFLPASCYASSSLVQLLSARCISHLLSIPAQSSFVRHSCVLASWTS